MTSNGTDDEDVDDDAFVVAVFEDVEETEDCLFPEVAVVVVVVLCSTCACTPKKKLLCEDPIVFRSTQHKKAATSKVKKDICC